MGTFVTKKGGGGGIPYPEYVDNPIIYFDRPRIHFSADNPTDLIGIDSSGAVPGVIQKIYLQTPVIPSVLGASFMYKIGSGEWDSVGVNLVIIEYVKVNHYEYWITQVQV